MYHKGVTKSEHHMAYSNIFLGRCNHLRPFVTQILSSSSRDAWLKFIHNIVKNMNTSLHMADIVHRGFILPIHNVVSKLFINLWQHKHENSATNLYTLLLRT